VEGPKEWRAQREAGPMFSEKEGGVKIRAWPKSKKQEWIGETQ